MPTDPRAPFPSVSASPLAPVIPPLVARHAGDAAFYWAQHDASVHSPLVTLAELAHFNRLLEAHLDGLFVAGDEGADIARQELTRWQGPGEFFVCAVNAMESDARTERMRALWPVLEADPERVLRGLISALAWVDIEGGWPFISRWLDAHDHLPLQVAAWRAIALIGHEAVELTGPLLDDVLRSPQPALRAAACRCAGQTPRIEALQPLLADPVREVRAEAAIALAGRLEPTRGAGVLWQAVAELCAASEALTGFYRARALHRLIRWVRQLGLIAPLGHPGVVQLLDHLPSRLALDFVFHHGDAAYLPWVAAHLDHPEIARRAGWVWQVLTGIDLESEGLALPPRALDDDEAPRPTDDLDPGLPEPDAAAVRARHLRLPVGEALLFGRPIAAPRLPELLGDQPQALRWIAAQRLRALGIHFDTRAPVRRQLAELTVIRARQAQAA